MTYSDITIPTSWAPLLHRYAPEAKRFLGEVTHNLDKRAATGETVYPHANQILAAMELTPPEAVKVVIIGQDPYHGPGQANGLAFSVAPGCKIPPSLHNIFAELAADIGGPEPQNGDLTPWAKQGVLLLNTTLTVRKGAPGSHRAIGWTPFVKEVLESLIAYRLNNIEPYPISLLWGTHAQQIFSEMISPEDGLPTICSTHPSPFSTMRKGGAVPAFVGSRPFSRANAYLREVGLSPINWTLN